MVIVLVMLRLAPAVVAQVVVGARVVCGCVVIRIEVERACDQHQYIIVLHWIELTLFSYSE